MSIGDGGEIKLESKDFLDYMISHYQGLQNFTPGDGKVNISEVLHGLRELTQKLQEEDNNE